MENPYFNSLNQTRIPVFSPGDRIYSEDYKKSGNVIALRDDSYERKERIKDPNRQYYYHIQFDDNSFDTYIPGNSIFKIWQS
jgi:hypothetical protein